MDADEIYQVKNSFWLGNFDEAIKEARSVKVRSPTVSIDRDVYIYRSFIGLGNYKCVVCTLDSAVHRGRCSETSSAAGIILEAPPFACSCASSTPLPLLCNCRCTFV